MRKPVAVVLIGDETFTARIVRWLRDHHILEDKGTVMPILEKAKKKKRTKKKPRKRGY
jgi:hypothetical protein